MLLDVTVTKYLHVQWHACTYLVSGINIHPSTEDKDPPYDKVYVYLLKFSVFSQVTSQVAILL